MKLVIQSVRVLMGTLSTGLSALRLALWLFTALVALGGENAQAQFYAPNYLTNNPGFEAVSLPDGGSISYGGQAQPINGWTFRGDSGIARDSEDKSSGVPAYWLPKYSDGNYAYLHAGDNPGTLEHTVHLPLGGEYVLYYRQFWAWSGYYLYYTVTITDAQGNVRANSVELGWDAASEALPFTATEPGPYTIKFHDVVDAQGTGNIVLLDNFSLGRTGYRSLTNGNFDLESLASGGFRYQPTLSQPVEFWAYSGSAGIATDSTNKAGFATGHATAYTNKNYAFLQAAAGTPGALEQSIVVPVTGQWLLSFNFAGRRAGTGFGGNARFRATVLGPEGSSLASTQLVATSGQLFTNVVLPFTAYVHGPFTLRFHEVQNVSGTDNTAFIDDVKLLVPGQYALLMVPNSSIDIINTTPARWHFFSSPTPSAARMSKVDASGIAETSWGNAGFAPDGNFVQNRIFPGQFLRVYSGNVPAGDVIRVESSFTPLGERFQFEIRVTDSPFVRSITLLDPSPTASSSVRWQVQLSHPNSGVSAYNFAFANPNGISGAAITSVTGEGTNWIVTANTGFGTGLLGLNWVATADERPNIPTKFTGHVYDLSPLPQFLDEPDSTNVVIGTAVTLRATAVVRDGINPTYQWYEGSSQTPAAAVKLTGQTGPTFSLPATSSGYSRQFFVRAANGPGYTRDSVTATVRAMNAPQIVTQPLDLGAYVGDTVTLSVSASGTAPFVYQWYRGALGDVSRPQTGGASFSTPPLDATSQYWVRVMNDAGPVYAVTSRVATVRVGTKLLQQPSDVTACLGGAARFEAAVTTGTAGTRLQWQKRSADGAFADVLNATNRTLLTAPVSAADDGSFYRLSIQNAETNLLTAGATLSVVTLALPTATYDFNSGLPTNTASYGDATASSGLQLTGPGSNQSGAWRTPDYAPGKLVLGFAAQFSLAMARTGSNALGDGFSFNWASDLPSGVYAAAEEGQGSGLSVCFDTFDNGGGEGPAFEVKWGGQLVARQVTTNGFLPGLSGDAANVTIRLSTNGTLDLTYRCASIFARLPIPGYAPQFSARFGLGARTRTASDAHVVDDLSLELYVEPSENLVPMPGLFNTGVDDAGTVLGDRSTDPHYSLVINPDSASPVTWAHESQQFPILNGPWMGNTELSKWIAPRTNTSAAKAGSYTYRTTFSLAGFSPADARIVGLWATDNVGTDLLLNGVSTGFRNTNEFARFTSFDLRNGFVHGTNTLDFVVTNADLTAGYTGLRVQMLGTVRAEAVVLDVQRQGSQVLVSWTPILPNQQLQAADRPDGPWQTIPAAVSPYPVDISPANVVRFYRLVTP